MSSNDVGASRPSPKEPVTPTTSSSRRSNDEEPPSLTDEVKASRFYHGLVPRADITPLLKKDGDFLLRKTENNGTIVLALSVHWEGQIKHFMINQDEKKQFYLEKHTEKTISDLIQWHKATSTPVSEASGVRIRQSIERPAWILNHDDVKMTKKLGEGAFGEVFMANYMDDGVEVQVAVKTMREEVSREARLKFMKEARLMRKLSHKHVVKILGIAVHEHPLLIVMELCLGGSVISYLRKNKGTPNGDIKLRFCTEGASGLAYLEKQNCIHRDIAARNCLLTDKNALKISDFGMSDDRIKLKDDKLDKVPVKWLAPETMQTRIYSSKSDVWSYGIMVWEIFADGAEPYPGLTNVQTRAKIIVQNYRMDLPQGTPPLVVKLVGQCWQKEPADRPTFATIFDTLKAGK